VENECKNKQQIAIYMFYFVPISTLFYAIFKIFKNMRTIPREISYTKIFEKSYGKVKKTLSFSEKSVL